MTYGPTSKTKDHHVTVRLVSDFQTLNGASTQPVDVRPGGRLVLNGSLVEELRVQNGATATINGVCSGDIRVAAGGRLVIRGTVSGEVRVAAGAILDILDGAVVLGLVTQGVAS